MPRDYEDPSDFGWLQGMVLLAVTLVIVYGLVFGCNPSRDSEPGPSVSPSLQWGRQPAPEGNDHGLR